MLSETNNVYNVYNNCDIAFDNQNLSQHLAIKIINDLDLKGETDEYKLILVRDFLEDFDDSDRVYLKIVFDDIATKLGQRDMWGIFLSEDQVETIVSYLQFN